MSHCCWFERAQPGVMEAPQTVHVWGAFGCVLRSLSDWFVHAHVWLGTSMQWLEHSCQPRSCWIDRFRGPRIDARRDAEGHMTLCDTSYAPRRRGRHPPWSGHYLDFFFWVKFVCDALVRSGSFVMLWNWQFLAYIYLWCFKFIHIWFVMLCSLKYSFVML